MWDIECYITKVQFLINPKFKEVTILTLFKLSPPSSILNVVFFPRIVCLKWIGSFAHRTWRKV